MRKSMGLDARSGQASADLGARPLAAAPAPPIRPDVVIGDQTATYVLKPPHNPFYIDGGTTITTSSGDGVVGFGAQAWQLNNAGTVDGAAAGVRLVSDQSSVTNSGAIYGRSGVGVGFAHGGSLDNQLGGMISGATGGVLIGGAGSVSNAGSITGGTAAGVAMLGGGYLTNANSGDITGRVGVNIRGAAGTVANTGAITGTGGAGVFLALGGTVTNNARATIAGQTNGVSIGGAAGSVGNYGTIVGAAGIGVALDDGGDLTNGSVGDPTGALIVGGATGVFLLGAGGIDNAGEIIATSYGYSPRTGPKGIGVDVRGLGGIGSPDGPTVTNSGAISGPAIGVQVLGGGELDNLAGGVISAGVYPGGYAYQSVGAYVQGVATNAGAIVSYSDVGLGLRIVGSATNAAGGLISAMYGYSAGVAVVGNLENAGTIQASAYGAVLAPGASVANDVGGTITADYWGVVAVDQFAEATISNAGLISATGVAGVGIYLYNVAPGYSHGLVTNSASGVIRGAAYGILEQGAFAEAITNAGLISGGYLGVVLTAAGVVTNQAGGRISADSGIGVGLAAGGSVINSAGATISAAEAVEIQGAAGTVTNAGAIKGAAASVVFGGGGDNKLVLQTGSVLTGKAIGSTLGGATNTLVLQGHGAAFNRFINFSALTVQALGTWRLYSRSAFGAATISTGTLQLGDAAHAGARLTINGSLENDGVLKVGGGAIEVTGAVAGSGSAVIAGGTLKFDASFGQDVAFTGASGLLQLAASQSYGGTISGFSLTGGTTLDLGDIQFVSGVTTATYVDNGLHTGGVLTVTDGAHWAQIKLTGDYSGSTFATSSDGGAGTLVVDPPKGGAPGSRSPKTAAVLPLISAMAGLDHGSGHWVAPAQSGRDATLLLAAPHSGFH